LVVIGAIEEFGQTKVGEVRLARAIDDDIARLEIAVEDAVFMGMMHRTCHQSDETGDAELTTTRAGLGLIGPVACHAKFSGSDFVPEAFTLHELHAQKRLPTTLADLIDGND